MCKQQIPHESQSEMVGRSFVVVDLWVMAEANVFSRLRVGTLRRPWMTFGWLEAMSYSVAVRGGSGNP